MAYLTVTVLLLCAVFDFGSAIMCYECNSATNPQCEGNQLPANLKRNCSELDRGVHHTLCRKIVQHVDYGGVNGQLPSSRVVRACGWDDSKYKLGYGNQLSANLMRTCSELDRGVHHTLCRKIVQHVDYGGVVRACGWDDSKYKGSCYHRAGYGGRQEVCSCTSDLCNGSRDLRGTALSIVFTIFLILGAIACQ